MENIKRYRLELSDGKKVYAHFDLSYVMSNNHIYIQCQATKKVFTIGHVLSIACAE